MQAFKERSYAASPAESDLLCSTLARLSIRLRRSIPAPPPAIISPSELSAASLIIRPCIIPRPKLIRYRRCAIVAHLQLDRTYGSETPVAGVKSMLPDPDAL